MYQKGRRPVPKTYKISELFFTSWQQIPTGYHAQLIDLRYKLNTTKAQEMWGAYGHLAIQILRILRKNKLLVAKINVEQAVDCLNDLKFLQDPWYHFPPGEKFDFRQPDDYMRDRTFNQFVHADAQFTKFCVLDHQGKQSGKADEVQINLAINKLIGILYTLPEKFDEREIHNRACTIDQKMNAAEKAVVLHTYANVREYIVKERCPNLFPAAQSSSEDSTPVYTGKMWLNLRYDLSETPSFQGLEAAKNAWLYDAMDLLEKKALEIAKQPKQIPA